MASFTTDFDVGDQRYHFFDGNLRGPLKCPRPPKKEDLNKGLLTIDFPVVRP